MAYEAQFTFKDCIKIKPLPFDFAVKMNSFLYLIEYQGEHHYQSINYGKSNTNLKEREDKDFIKKQYANSNHIPLLIIPYTEIDNIEILLGEFFDINIIKVS